MLTNDIERLVCSYDWPCYEALTVMWCESGGRADAWNRTAVWIGGVENHASGLFQLMYPLHAGLIGGDPFDPALNVAAAYRLWTGRGWAAWGCSP